MRSWKKNTLLALFLALFLSTVGGRLLAQQPDEIRRTSGGNLTGIKILSESYKEVRYKRGAYDGKIGTEKVLQITYGDTPEAYTNGLSFLEKGEYENAVNSFKLAMEKTTVRPWIKTYGLLQTGRAFQLFGVTAKEKYKDAIKAYDDLLSLDPETRFYASVLFEKAKCQAASGDVPAAVKTFDLLAQEAYDKKLGLLWEAKAKIEKAVVQLEAGLFEEADRDFRSALTFAMEQAKSAEDEAVKAELGRIAGMARLNQGTVMIRRKKYSEARSFFEQIIQDENSELNAKAGSENGLGEILFAEKKWKEAQVQFSKAKVLYLDIPEEGARACYYLGLICLELEKAEPNYRRRAKEYFQEVIQWYPETEWAKKAQEKNE